tara:strand:- start:1043 stop:1339 length:297 start_codon:yes stop_codon:yes gene_type:complete
MEQTKVLDDAIAEANGSRTIYDQFRDIRVSVTKAWDAITGIDIRVTVTEANIMDLRADNSRLRADNSRLVEENGQIKHNITVITERLMRLEKEKNNAS